MTPSAWVTVPEMPPYPVLIVRFVVVEVVNDPAVAVIVKGKVPVVLMELLVVTAIVVVPLADNEAGVKVAVAPLGNPETENDTAPVVL